MNLHKICLIACLLLIFSCSDDDTAEVSQKNFMVAKIDGEAWETNDVSVRHVDNNGVEDVYSFMGKKVQGQQREDIHLNISLGTDYEIEARSYSYNFDDCYNNNFNGIACSRLFLNFGTVDNPINSNSYTSQFNGSDMVITFNEVGLEIGDIISGTFSGTLRHITNGNNKTLTEGRFRMEIE